MGPRLVSVLLLLSAVLTSAVPHAQTQAPAMKGYPALGAPPIITVLAPGSAPRKALRYVIPATQKSRVDGTMSLALAVTVDGMDVDPAAPPMMTFTVNLGVTSVAPNGSISYDLAFTGMTLEGGTGGRRPSRSLQEMVTRITSIKGSATASDRGVIQSVKLELGPAMKQMLGQIISAVENLPTPFPDAEVGVGARWEVRQAIAPGGLTTFVPTVFQRTEYEVVSIDGPTVSLKMKTEQTAPPQSLIDPSFPVSNNGIVAGAENSLKKMSGSGSGTAVVRLDSLVPTSELQSTAAMVIAMSMNGQPIALTADGKIKITIGPGK